jgi:hypothetical protein
MLALDCPSGPLGGASFARAFSSTSRPAIKSSMENPLPEPSLQHQDQPTNLQWRFSIFYVSELW